MFYEILYFIVAPFILACFLQFFKKRTAVTIGILVPIVYITVIPIIDSSAVGALFELLYFIYVPVFAAMSYIFWIIIGYAIERIRGD